MPWLAEYCEKAALTDQFTARPDHVDMLATGLFGECGSVLAELKKTRREGRAYPLYRIRLIEEIGDALWYLVRLFTVLAPSELREPDGPQATVSQQDGPDSTTAAFTLGSAAGAVLRELQRDDRSDPPVSQLAAVWSALQEVSCAAGVKLSDAARRNLEKTQSRWPPICKPHPLFDECFDEVEQIPRKLTLEFREVDQHYGKAVILRCNGLNLGDRLTDNAEDPDSYRFHDVFHLAHAAYLGWSPVLRSHLKCKRKSDPSKDENQDGARAQIIEEAVTAIVFSRAKELQFYEGIDQVDYDLLESVHEFVGGFEVAEVPLWQWEQAILNGYCVFRDLQSNRGGVVTLDMYKRELRFVSPQLSHETATKTASIAIAGN